MSGQFGFKPRFDFRERLLDSAIELNADPAIAGQRKSGRLELPAHHIVRNLLAAVLEQECRGGTWWEPHVAEYVFEQLLAGWVLLMDKSLLALDQAVAAAKGGDSAAGVSGLTDASIELRVFAEQMKAIRLKQ